MRWPIELRLGGSPPPATPPVALPQDRPSSVVGFLSDLSRNPKEAFTFVMIIGGILVITALCFTGVCVAVITAARGIKGIPLRYILSVGISGASLLTLAASLITRWIRRSVRASRANGATERTQGDS
jgi:MFS family permease